MSMPVRRLSSFAVDWPMPPSFLWPNASSSPDSEREPPGDQGALGNGHDRVVGRAVRAVFGEQAGEALDVERHLGDDGAIDFGEVGGVQRRLPRVAAEELDHADALVRADGGAEVGEHVDRARDRSREADAVVGAEDVVVHRLGDGDDADAGVMQDVGEAQGVVATDGDQRVEAEGLDHAHGVLGAIDLAAVLLHAVAGAHEGRHAIGLDVARVGARRVQDRAAGAVDLAYGLGGQGDSPGADRSGIGRVDVEEARPAA